MVKIQVLIEERAFGAGFKSEHGLSLLVEVRGRRWVFDTGQTGLVAENIRRSDISPGDIEGIIISHGHYDHTGGIMEILKWGWRGSIYAHPGIFRERWNIRTRNSPRAIGCPFSRSELEASGAALVLSRAPSEISSGICLSGEIKREKEWISDPALVIEKAGNYVPDPFIDEQYLVIIDGEEMIVITGCCHAGLINTIEDARSAFPQRKLKAVIGGFHLHSLPPMVLKETIEHLSGYQPERIIAGHCTGTAAEKQLKKTFGKRFQRMMTGEDYLL